MDHNLSQLVANAGNGVVRRSSIIRTTLHSVVSGNERYRFPVSLERALTTAGAIDGTGASPAPVGASVLGTMWTSAPGHELHLRTPPRWRHRWTGRRQPEVLEDGLDRATFDEEREHHPATATAVALEHLLAEDAAQQLSPGQSGRGARSGRCLRPAEPGRQYGPF
jgi:hypothetical protein